ncbi:MAG: UDP-N-acetylglucosamine pyrophosphorylase, partial [Proteobacteria bacterium]|nr:UDP-N-acetylglucosamine pyrophosphorylase [Pseudomonadota bacterium]
MIIGKAPVGKVINITPRSYKNISRVIQNNLLYLANLTALEQWYMHIRQLFFKEQKFGDLIYDGLMDNISLAKKERAKRLKAMAEKMPASLKQYNTHGGAATGKQEFHDHSEEAFSLFLAPEESEEETELRHCFLAGFHKHKEEHNTGYIHIIQSLPASVSQDGVRWLNRVVETRCQNAATLMPGLQLFKK